MSKVKEIKNVISKEQLSSINEQQNLLNEIIHRIGLIETEKHSLLHRVAEVNKKVEEIKLELEQEYGKVSIDLKTGEYSPIEEEDNAIDNKEN
jgi:hypothetical protein